MVKKGMKMIHAVYEEGVFRPLEKVELPERTEVEFEPRPVESAKDQNGSLNAIYDVLAERYTSGERDVAARHNEHQP
jgi:predicted DNA-binding antitoxin AbrB/MazE fold protein